MAFRDYSQQFAPVNVFGGLGKGLGEGLGRGVTKSIRRPLFKKLADKFRTENEAKAQLNTLAQMGLQAPPVQGDTQYPIFQDMMAQNLSVLNQRPDRAQELWETDQEAAQEYLLGEDKLYAAKGGSTKITKEELRAMPGAQAALAEINEAEQEIIDASAVGDNSAYAAAMGKMKRAARKYQEITGQKVDLDTMNQYRDLFLTPLKQEKEELDIQAKKLGIGSDALKQAQAFAEKKITAGPANKLVDQANQLKPAVSRIQGFINNFDKLKENPSALFAAVKSLAQIIEPGLQVTEGEARAFLGETAVQKFVQAIQQSGEAGKALVEFFNTNKTGKALDSAAAAAGYDSPDQLWELLVLATNVASDTQSAYRDLLGEIPLRAMAASDANMEALFTGNNITSPAKKRAIQSAIDMNISTGYPDIVPITPIPYGTPMPGATPPAGAGGGDGDSQGTWNWQDRYKEGDLWPYAPNEKYSGPQTYPDGTEVSLTDDWRKLRANELEAKKGAGKGAKASPTKNPIKGQASAGAAEMSDKVVDDLLAQGGY